MPDIHQPSGWAWTYWIPKHRKPRHRCTVCFRILQNEDTLACDRCGGRAHFSTCARYQVGYTRRRGRSWMTPNYPALVCCDCSEEEL